jgi:hypothetical protein
MEFLHFTRKRKINGVEMITELMKGYYHHFIRDLPFLLNLLYFIFFFDSSPGRTILEGFIFLSVTMSLAFVLVVTLLA